MKTKPFAGAMAAAMLAGSLMMFGCSASNDAEEPQASSGEEQQAAQEQQVDSDYAVTIDACDPVSDYEGNPAAVVTYTWTNNSDEAQMFSVAIHAQVFQNGVELGSAILSTGDYDFGASMREVQPGGTQTVYMAYKLADQSDVSVQCEEAFSFDDVVLAEASFPVA